MSSSFLRRWRCINPRCPLYWAFGVQLRDRDTVSETGAKRCAECRSRVVPAPRNDDAAGRMVGGLVGGAVFGGAFFGWTGLLLGATLGVLFASW